MSNLKPLHALIIAIASGFALGKEVMADGKVDFKDLPLLWQEGPGFVKQAMDAGQHVKEISFRDLSADEASELSGLICSYFKVDPGKAKFIIDGSFEILAGSIKLARGF